MSLLRIGITMGDAAGIGPEVIRKALTRPDINKLGRFLVIGDAWVFKQATRRLPPQAASLEFIDLKNICRRNFKFGRIKKEYGQAAIAYLEKAAQLIKNKQIDCLVTAPLSKASINLAGYKYSGHTEFLARAFHKTKFDLTMLLLNRYLKVGLVTRHIALKEVSRSLSRKAVYKTIIATHAALKNYFNIPCPRISVAAFNPHAAESGLLGAEEKNKILPAIKAARKRLGYLCGPLPADTAFLAASNGRADAVVAMYHDQALIPLKILCTETGVNLTLGLDFVRTSPLHGTAFDIAGKDIASAASFVAAIRTAVECTQNVRDAFQPKAETAPLRGHFPG